MRVDTAVAAGQSALVPIDFLDLLAEDGWAPVSVVPEGAVASWCGDRSGTDAAPLEQAPVDVAATFDSARRSTGIDPSFGLYGVRLSPGFVGPSRRHDQPVLMIVVGGSLAVRCAPEPDADEAVEHRLRAGEFCIIDEATVHSVDAGDDGATYTECWPQGSEAVMTTWFQGDGWVEQPSAGRLVGEDS